MNKISAVYSTNNPIQINHAKYYLKSQQNDTFSCHRCFQPQLQMLCCIGQCQKSFCKKCCRNIGYNEHSQDCKGREFKSIYRQNIEFICPSNKKQCTSVIRTQEQFQKHSITCQYLSQDQRCQFKARRSFHCLEGHQLAFPLSRTQCFLCGSLHCVSDCQTCHIGFCTVCRILPCTKTKCPKRHNFQTRRDSNSITCDLCGIHLRFLSEKLVYTDRQCNFDICASCHEKVSANCYIQYQFEAQISDESEDEMEAY